MNDPIYSALKGFWYLLKVLVVGEPPRPDPFSIRKLERRSSRNKSLERILKQLKHIQNRIEYYNIKSCSARDLWGQLDYGFRIEDLERVGDEIAERALEQKEQSNGFHIRSEERVGRQTAPRLRRRTP